jgi:hypothetical protein
MNAQVGLLFTSYVIKPSFAARSAYVWTMIEIFVEECI